MPIETFMFRSKHKKHLRNPEQFEREQALIRQWLTQKAARTAAQKQEEGALRSAEQIKKEELERMKAMAHTAFMTHPAATEEDFDRCWPAMRDEMFRQHAIKVLAATQVPDESLTDIEAAFRLFLSERDSSKVED